MDLKTLIILFKKLATTMKDLTKKILTNFTQDIDKIKSLLELEQIRIKYLGKKSEINNLFSQLKNLNNEEKKSAGSLINNLRLEVTQIIDQKKNKMEIDELNKNLHNEKMDLTTPTRKDHISKLHPLSKTIYEVRKILNELGFNFEEGPEIEDDFHNFSALNGTKGPSSKTNARYFLLE